MANDEQLNALLAYWLNISGFFKNLLKTVWKWQSVQPKVHVLCTTIQEKHKQLKFNERRENSRNKKSKNVTASVEHAVCLERPSTAALQAREQLQATLYQFLGDKEHQQHVYNYSH
jgi:hypothetical protein